jgi:hypothetical protein
LHAPVASDGTWVMLAPLPVGTHTIRFGGAFPTLSFTLDVQYTVIVDP